MARAMNERRPRAGGLFVGRLDAESGTGTLLEALDLFPGARVEVIGAGPEEPRLRAQCRARHDGRWRGDLRRFYRLPELAKLREV